MKFKSNKLSLALSAALSLGMVSNAQAVAYGEMVTDATFKDWAVKLIRDKGTGGQSYCSGMLVGGKYVITAAHCLLDDPNNVESTNLDTGEVQDIIAQNITVYYGSADYTQAKSVGVSAAVIDVNYSAIQTAIGASSLSDWLMDIGHEYFGVNFDPDEDFYSGSSDIAVLTLAETVAQADTLALGWDKYADRAYEGELVNMIGWGLNEDGNYPTVANKASMSYALSFLNRSIENPYFSFGGYHIFERTEAMSSIAASGDSGAVFYIENTALGNVSTSTRYMSNGGSTDISSFSFVQGFLLEELNMLAYPTQVNERGSGQLDRTLVVQNLTNGDYQLTPTLFDETGFFDADLTACNVLLGAGESCEVVLTTRAGSAADSGTAYIELAEGERITLSLNTSTEEPEPPVEPEEPEDPNQPSEGTESSGGSSGPVFMLLLVGAWCARRWKRGYKS